MNTRRSGKSSTFLGDDAARRSRDRPGHRRLRRAEHLHRLRGALDRDLVGHERVGLRGQVGRNDREEVRVALALVEQSLGERLADGPVLRANQQVDVSDLVALADERLANAKRRQPTILSPPNLSRFPGRAPTTRRRGQDRTRRGTRAGRVGRSALAGEHLDALARIVMVAQQHVLLARTGLKERRDRGTARVREEREPVTPREVARFQIEHRDGRSGTLRRLSGIWVN